MHLTIIFLGLMTVTSYRSVPSQTDDTPFITSIGERVHPYGVAVSQDMLCPRAKHFPNVRHKVVFDLCQREESCPKPLKLHYHDVLYVQGAGLRVINDTMHPRHRRHIDLWVATYAEEKAVGWRKQQKVYLIKHKGDYNVYQKR